MQVAVTFRHMEPTDALKSYSETKVEKINKFILLKNTHTPIIVLLACFVENCVLSLQNPLTLKS